jgi:hypothetical protein
MVDISVDPFEVENARVAEFTEDDADFEIKKLAMKGIGAEKNLLVSGKYSIRITDWLD